MRKRHKCGVIRPAALRILLARSASQCESHAGGFELLQLLALETSTSGAELLAVERLITSQAQEILRWMEEFGCPVVGMATGKSTGLLPMLDLFKINLRHMMTVFSPAHAAKPPLTPLPHLPGTGLTPATSAVGLA